MKQLKFLSIVLFFLVLFNFLQVSAYVNLPSVINDNMVLQSGIKIPIWGTAEPGEKVTVSINYQKEVTTASEEGKWMVKLNPMKSGGPFEMTVSGKNTITLRNILVGEVWICSGQSNMAMTVNRSANPEQEVAGAKYPKIRLFTAKRTTAETPQKDVEGQWSECSPETVGEFSAAAYFFGRNLYKDLNIPVGLIHTSWGGTPSEAWTSLSTLKSFPDFNNLLDRWGQVLLDSPAALESYEKELAEWEKIAEKAKSEGKPVPRQPRLPYSPNHPHRPANLYNGMIAPFIPYAIKGAIWYQGESNADRAYEYRSVFPTMIRDWRQRWRQGDFPFLFVQLANYRQRQPEPVDDTWAELREAQLMTLSLPNTEMASAIDIGEADDIHPKNKQDVVYRLSLGALALAYGKALVYSGPIYESCIIEDNKIRLHFKHIGSGLTTKGAGLKGFAIAGPDKKFVWAEAKIEGNEVVVRSEKVPNPAAVRYAWQINPECNLYNKEGLPASPFRTDSLPGMTVGK